MICRMLNCIAEQDFSSLEGIVTNNMLEQVKSNFSGEEIIYMTFACGRDT